MLLVKNRKALFNNELIEKYIAGIVLYGYELKAIKEKNASFEGAYIIASNDEIFVKNIHVGKYSKQSQEYVKENASRERKLLLNKNEIFKIQKELLEKGKTAVPLAFILKNGKVKLEFAIVKGRKKHEKKQLLKKKQLEKDLAQEKKSIWH